MPGRAADSCLACIAHCSRRSLQNRATGWPLAAPAGCLPSCSARAQPHFAGAAAAGGAGPRRTAARLERPRAQRGRGAQAGQPAPPHGPSSRVRQRRQQHGAAPGWLAACACRQQCHRRAGPTSWLGGAAAGGQRCGGGGARGGARRGRLPLLRRHRLQQGAGEAVQARALRAAVCRPAKPVCTAGCCTSVPRPWLSRSATWHPATAPWRATTTQALPDPQPHPACSGLHKPDDQTVLPPPEAAAFVAPLPVRALPGVGACQLAAAATAAWRRSALRLHAGAPGPHASSTALCPLPRVQDGAGASAAGRGHGRRPSGAAARAPGRRPGPPPG